ncbi:hypothetical protein [Actinocorallia longicatena]|uniref:Uncharacterized protein n=1 Tax=Actinocorallia longicatena TaxID=111803 RepID=A0ABP6QJZ2_9ACTN
MAYVWRDVVGAERLCEVWRSHSMRTWTLPCDWWTPAVEALAEAVASGRPAMRDACRLGISRGRAGIGIGETLDDLAALATAVGWPDPPLRLVRAIAEGWAEAGITHLAGPACEDPLTGLATLPYLRSRLAEIYREAIASATPADSTHTLVMIEVNDDSPSWRRLARAVVVGHDLRAVFPGGETLTLISSGHAAALVPLRPSLGLQTARLRRALRETALVWVERLPPTHRDALALLEAIAP